MRWNLIVKAWQDFLVRWNEYRILHAKRHEVYLTDHHEAYERLRRIERLKAADPWRESY